MAIALILVVIIHEPMCCADMQEDGFQSLKDCVYLTNSCGVNVLKQRAQVGEAVVHIV